MWDIRRGVWCQEELEWRTMRPAEQSPPSARNLGKPFNVVEQMWNCCWYLAVEKPSSFSQLFHGILHFWPMANHWAPSFDLKNMLALGKWIAEEDHSNEEESQGLGRWWQRWHLYETRTSHCVCMCMNLHILRPLTLYIFFCFFFFLSLVPSGSIQSPSLS